MSAPKKLLVTINYLGGGGAESHALRLVNHVDRDRYVPSVAVTARGGSYERFLREDVAISAISSRRVRSSSIRQTLSAFRMRERLTGDAPDVVLPIMDFMSIVTMLTSLTITARRFKVVPVVQIPPSIEYARSRFGRTVILPGIRRLYAHSDGVIALSRGVRDDLVEIDPRLASRITVIHNACVDDRLEAPQAADNLPTTDLPVVLAAGRLLPQKGFPYLLDAFADVRRRARAELWIIGEGPDRAALEAQIARLGLGESVRLLGFQPNPYAFMRRASVFCLSSVYEGFGNVVVEAMACGAPVVSTSCPHGPSEIIRRDEEGLLVAPRNPEALADALVRVLDDPELRERMKAAGRRRALDFHARTIAASYADELDRILAERAPSRW